MFRQIPPVFFYGKGQGKRAVRSPDGKWSPPPATPCNTRGAAGALPADKVGWAPDPVLPDAKGSGIKPTNYLTPCHLCNRYKRVKHCTTALADKPRKHLLKDRVLSSISVCLSFWFRLNSRTVESIFMGLSQNGCGGYGVTYIFYQEILKRPPT